MRYMTIICVLMCTAIYFDSDAWANSFTSLHSYSVQHTYIHVDPQTGQEVSQLDRPRSGFRERFNLEDPIVRCRRSICNQEPENYYTRLSRSQRFNFIPRRNAFFVPPGTRYIAFDLYTYAVMQPDVKIAMRYGTKPSLTYTSQTTVPPEQPSLLRIGDYTDNDIIFIAQQWGTGVFNLPVSEDNWGKWFYFHFFHNQGNIYEFDVSIQVEVDVYRNWYRNQPESFWEDFDRRQPNADVNQIQRSWIPYISINDAWSTELALLASEQPFAGTFEIFNSQGQAIRSCDLNLPARGRLDLQRCAEEPESEMAGASSQCPVQCLPADSKYALVESETQKVVGYTKYFNEEFDRASVPLPGQQSLQNLSIPYIVSNQDWETGFGMLNTANSRRSTSWAFNQDGTRPSTEFFNAREQKGIAASTLAPGGNYLNLAAASVGDSEGLIGVSLTSDLGNNRMAGWRLTGQTAQSVVLPHCQTSGSNDMTSQLMIYNPNSTQVHLGFTEYTSDGQPLQQAENSGEILLPNAQVSKACSPGAVWMRVTADQPISAAGLTVSSDSFAGIDVMDAAMKNGIFPKLDKDGWNVVVLVNVEEEAAQVTMKAVDDDGVIVSSRPINIAKHQQRIFTNDALTSLFGNATNYQNTTHLRFISNRNIVGVQFNGSEDMNKMDALSALPVLSQDVE